jgi:hypothetical protein
MVTVTVVPPTTPPKRPTLGGYAQGIPFALHNRVGLAAEFEAMLYGYEILDVRLRAINREGPPYPRKEG